MSGDAPPSPAAPDARFAEALDRFVLFWGEMASRWGINRTMAQIHALLYACEDPLDTDAIMSRLNISRGNANMNLRSLLDWGLVKKIHVTGSRKDYFRAEKDVWELTAQIVQHREQLEIKPVKQQLEDLRAHLTEGRAPESLPEPERRFCGRMDSLIGLMEVFEGFSEVILPLLRQQNAPMIKQLIGLAAMLRHGAEPAAPPPHEH